MKLISIFYINDKFQQREMPLKNKLLNLGFDNVICYNEKWLKTTPFYMENKEILNISIGAGYWLWKPYIILETLKNVENEDIVFYIDAGDNVRKGIVETIKKYMLSNDYIFTTWFGRGKNAMHTKRDCFILMDCDNENYYNAIHIEAGSIVMKKNDFNVKILNEWLFYCKNKKIIGDEPSNIGDELIEFQKHCRDQSILSNVIKKNNLKTTNVLVPYITYHDFIP